MLIEKRELELEFFLADAVRFVPMDLCVVDCSVQQTNGCESFQFPPFATPVLPVEPCQIADSGARCDWLSVPDVSYNLEIHGYPEASTPLRVMAQRKSTYPACGTPALCTQPQFCTARVDDRGLYLLGWGRRQSGGAKRWLRWTSARRKSSMRGAKSINWASVRSKCRRFSACRASAAADRRRPVHVGNAGIA